MSINPVERRLLGLCHEWESFRADGSKRLLIWRAPDNASRLLQCFFETQKHETAYATGDLFIVFDSPFIQSIRYSRDLKEALTGQYDASREELKQQGITPDWDFTPGMTPDSASGFVSSLRSFAANHGGHTGHVVAVFMPQSVADERAFTAWLSRALNAVIPQGLRLMAVDSLETPHLEEFDDSVRPLVQLRTIRIDAMVTAQETFAQEGGVGPAAVFRNHLMSVVTLVEKGSADQVKAKAADALAFARKQKWADQEIVIAVLVAGALLKEKRSDEAAQTYRDARQAALRTVEEGHPAGQKLVLQTWFGEAGAHLAGGDAKRAAECYDEAAEVARNIPDPILAIEALRMGSFCMARMENRPEAIEKARCAMLLGRELKPEEREMSTLPLAAVDLLRVIEPERVRDIDEIGQRLRERVCESRRSLEEKAAAMEMAGDTALTDSEEEQLKTDEEQAQQEAAAELDELVKSGHEEFQAAFADARDLLGEQWPLFSHMALPYSPADKSEMTGQGSTAI